MPFWDNNNGGAVDVQSPAYNYALELEQLKRQRALAQSQADTQMPDGKMVSGWYVAPSAGGYIAAGLQKLLGTYALNHIDQAEKDNSAKAQSNVTALAQALQSAQGKQTGTDANGNPTYAPASFTDKLPIYQQLQNSGPFGQFVAQHGIERDLAGPSLQKLGEGEVGYMINKDGQVVGQLSGGQKKTELDNKILQLQRAHPELTLQQVTDLASGQAIYDDNSGRVINKATGRDMSYGNQAPSSALPLATSQQPPASGAPVQAPARGQTFTGPQASVLPLTNGRQAPVNSAQEFRQQKQSQELAPKIKAANDALASLQSLENSFGQLEDLIGGDKPKVVTGHARGLFARTTGNLFDNADQDRFEKLTPTLALDRIQSMPGMTQVFNSNEESKRLAATLPSRSHDNAANMDNLKNARAILAEKRANLIRELQGYGVDTSSYQQPAPTQTTTKFSW